MRARLPALAVLLAALCFATTGTAQEIADVDASPAEVGLARILLGGALLAAWAGVAARSRRPQHPVGTTDAADRPADAVPTPVWVGVGAVGVVGYQVSFFAGTASAGVAVGTVVALGSAPVATGVLDAVVRRRRPDRRWFAATTLAVAGVALVAGVAGGLTLAWGLAWSVGAGLSYALYTVAGKELLDRSWSSAATMGTMFGIAALVAVPALLVAGADWLLDVRALALVLWLGVVTTTVAYLLFGWGLARLPAAVVATLTLAEPLGATALGGGLLGERLDAAAVAGLLVLGAGLALLTLGGPRTAPRALAARAGTPD